MITENKNIIILIIALIGFFIYTLIKNIRNAKKFNEEYKKILANENYKVKGQYS